MKEIQVPGSAPARNDKTQIWSVEMDEFAAIKELRARRASSEEEVLEFIKGDSRSGIRFAAQSIITNLRKDTDGRSEASEGS